MKMIVLAVLAGLQTAPALAEGGSASGSLTDQIALGTAEAEPGIATASQVRVVTAPAERPDR